MKALRSMDLPSMACRSSACTTRTPVSVPISTHLPQPNETLLSEQAGDTKESDSTHFVKNHPNKC